MSQILENIRNVDPNDSDAVKEIITAFFQHLPKHTELNCNVWLRVLESVITRFPRFCGQHRNTIENYLVHFLDSTNYYNVIAIGKCAHGLQQIRPSQDKAATSKNCWREQMSILCHTAHKLIEALFSKTIDIYKGSKNIKKLDAPLLANAPLTKALAQILNIKKAQNGNALDKNLVLCNKLRNIFVLIQAMLVEIYPVAKPIQPQLILQVIVQALTVSSSASTNVTEATTVKTQALRTLDALISCLGPNLIPFSALVFRCVMQTLRWSSDNPSEESKQVRCAAYSTLVKWLGALHVHRAATDGKGRAWEDDVTEHIINDITPPKKVVQLTMSNQFTKNLSKKARKKLANTMLQQSTIASHMPGEKNKITESEENNNEVANAALQCAETFLNVCGIFLKPATHKLFQERLIRECYNVECRSPDRAALLLRAADSCRRNSPPSVPPPTHYLLHLYSTLVNSPSDEIKKFCSQALLEIRLHLHCSPPSLSFALEAQPTKKKAEDKRKRLSDRNVAALEALLGKERMPAPTEDIITIPDEPTVKRPRLEAEVITENISVSSDSAKSIEISDDEDEDDGSDDEIILDIEQEENPEIAPIETVEESNEGTSSKSAAVYDDTSEQNVDKDDDIVDGANISQSVPESDTNEPEVTPDTNIYEAKTQLPLNNSNDTIEGDKSPVSMEVIYDPDGTNKVTVIDKMDDENLPSSNDTDDVQITCGQAIQSSQELDADKNKAVEEITKVNGINKTDSVVEANKNKDVIENLEVKITTKEITVDDMLADFVDEVIEEGKTEA